MHTLHCQKNSHLRTFLKWQKDTESSICYWTKHTRNKNNLILNLCWNSVPKSLKSISFSILEDLTWSHLPFLQLYQYFSSSIPSELTDWQSLLFCHYLDLLFFKILAKPFVKNTIIWHFLFLFCFICCYISQLSLFRLYLNSQDITTFLPLHYQHRILT